VKQRNLASPLPFYSDKIKFSLHTELFFPQDKFFTGLPPIDNMRGLQSSDFVLNSSLKKVD